MRISNMLGATMIAGAPDLDERRAGAPDQLPGACEAGGSRIMGLPAARARDRRRRQRQSSAWNYLSRQRRSPII